MKYVRLGLVLLLLLGMGRALADAGAVTISAKEPERIGDFITAAARAGARRVVVPAGVYRVAAEGREAGVVLTGLKNCELDFSGVTIVATDLTKYIFEMRGCSGVTLVGGTFTRDPPGFSQGRIEAIAADRRSIDIRISRGYPTNVDDPDYAHGAPKILALFDAKTRDWVRGADDVWYNSIERLGPDLFRFHLRDVAAADFPIEVGQLAAWRGNGQHSVFFEMCRNLTLDGITVCNSGGFTFWEAMGDGNNHYKNCRVVRGPAPEGADKNETPLFSSACDGFHSTSVRHGPTYENCAVEFNDDDAFAVHGFGAFVTEGQGDTITVAYLDPELAFNVGDHLRLNDANGALAGEAAIVGSLRVPGYAPPQAPPGEFRLFAEKARDHALTYRELKLDHPIPAGFAWIASDTDAMGNGYVIRNCGVYHNRERGMMIKASDGLIENNIVDGPTVGGIVFTPEVEFWDEVDFARNTTIRNNTIRDVPLWRSSLGALNLSEWRGGVPVPSPGGFRDIVVEGNTFENDSGVNVVIGSAQNVTLRENKFIVPMQQDKGTAWQIPSASLYWITNSRQITLENNSIVHPGPDMKTVLQLSGTTANIEQK